MNILDNIEITADMIAAATSVAEPAPGEALWAADKTWQQGERCIRTQTHRVYECVKDMGGPRATVPELDEQYWLDAGPTQRFAPFDLYINTAAQATGSITYVLSPGYFNALALYGLVGEQYQIALKDAPGGAVIWPRNGFLREDADGWYEYLFRPPRRLSKLFFSGLPIRPGAELTITISAAAGNDVAIGMILAGDMAPLISDAAQWGGVECGATAEPVTYSYINTAEDGTTKIVRRHSATNLRCSVSLPRRYADGAVALLQKTLDRPLAWIASTTAPGYAGLNVFGIASSAPVSYDSYGIASIEITVKGLI